MTIERRPGIDKIIAQVKAEHPRWNMPQIVSVAKQRYSSPTITKTVDGKKVVIDNPDFMGGHAKTG